MAKKRKKKGVGVVPGSGKGFPTLGDLKRKIPPKGLLDPSLRKTAGKIPGLA